MCARRRNELFSRPFCYGPRDDSDGNVVKIFDGEMELPAADNTAKALQVYRAANERFRQVPWPKPFHKTSHSLFLRDARDLSAIKDRSVHLVVTSPPYWTLKDYPDAAGQLGAIEDYTRFLVELDKVWRECLRVLVPGGRICCVVGDVCLPRKRTGRHQVMPLHADIQVRARSLGLDVLTPILWHKVANGVTEAEGNGAGFYGKPYQPGSIVKNDIEYILSLRKGGEYRKIRSASKSALHAHQAGDAIVATIHLDGHSRRVVEERPSGAVSARTCRAAHQTFLICGRHGPRSVRRHGEHGRRCHHYRSQFDIVGY